MEVRMGPSVAEVTRTLLWGRLRGSVHMAGLPDREPVIHATDCAGLPMLLVRRGGRADDALHAPAGARVVLRVADVPPLHPGPSLGEAAVEGRPRPLDGPLAAPAVLEFAEANPVPELFDVGGDMALHLLEPQHVRLARAGTVVGVDVGDYMAADPDPLHEHERDLLLDLADHHCVEMEGYFRRHLAAARVDWITAPRAVRLDRYGFTLDVGLPEGARPRWVRLNFARPVADRHELAHRLHPVLFHSGR
jgi:hypothetical protein